jgi:hypothetical protein
MNSCWIQDAQRKVKERLCRKTAGVWSLENREHGTWQGAIGDIKIKVIVDSNGF